jgi:hypothetical protein
MLSANNRTDSILGCSSEFGERRKLVAAPQQDLQWESKQFCLQVFQETCMFDRKHH